MNDLEIISSEGIRALVFNNNELIQYIVVFSRNEYMNYNFNTFTYILHSVSYASYIDTTGGPSGLQRPLHVYALKHCKAAYITMHIVE